MLSEAIECWVVCRSGAKTFDNDADTNSARAYVKKPRDNPWPPRRVF
jgi:hypothetical protein